MNEKPTMTAAEFMAAMEKETKLSTSLTSDQLHDFAIHALDGLRGISRADKLKVLRRMRKLMDA